MIEILLPVYNGEKYLREQIDSILSQTNKDWILKIRNDGSTDESEKIIDEYVANFPDKILRISEPKRNVGLVQSLNTLKKASPHGEYMMLSDQDDVWLPTKIEDTYREIRQQEDSGDIPILICTDAKCVDSDLNLKNESFFNSQKFPIHDFHNPHKIIALNVIQGSTIIMNRKAVELVFPVPTFLSYHDMWMGLMVSQYGKVKYIHKSMMLYRQHSDNVLGSLNINSNYYFSKFKNSSKIIKKLILLKKTLPFPISISKVIYFKLKFMLERLRK